LLTAVLCLVWLTFSPAADFDLLSWDDDINLQGNPHLTGLSAASLKWMFTDFTYQWRYQPLAWVTWFTIYEFQGLDPAGYHLVNLLLHLGNTVLIYLIARRLLARVNQGEVSAVLAAALWSVHPLRVETVVWAVELLYCQALFFLLLSFLAYLKANEGADVGRTGRRWRMVSITMFAFSLFTFPLALGFVAVLVVTDVYLLKRLPESPKEWVRTAAKRVWLEKVPFVVLTLLAAGLSIACRANAKAMFSEAASLADFGLMHRAMQAFYLWAYYVWRPWWPVELTPVPTQLYDFEPFQPVFLASAAIVIVGTAMTFRLRQRYPALWAVWLVHLAVLVPKLGLLEHPHFPSDRYSLVAGIGWAILVAGLWATWIERVRWRVVPVSAALALVVLLATLSARQLPFWANNYSFFPHVLAQLPEHPFRFNLLTRLAMVHRQAGLRKDAEEYLLAALEVRPQAFAQRLSLADTQMVLGKRSQARQNYLLVLEQAPQITGVHARLARMYLEEGNYAAAARALGNELQVAPPSFALEMQYGLALARSGELDAAQKSFMQLDARYQMKQTDIFACQLALADGLAAKGELLKAIEIADSVKERAEAAGVPQVAQQAVLRLRRWVPVALP